jgi:hypothetical protein
MKKTSVKPPLTIRDQFKQKEFKDFYKQFGGAGSSLPK